MKDVYPEDIECVMDPVGGKGGVFIGNLESAENPKTLSRTKPIRFRPGHQSRDFVC